MDLDGDPHLAGRLWSRSRQGRETATFEYDAASGQQRSTSPDREPPDDGARFVPFD